MDCSRCGSFCVEKLERHDTEFYEFMVCVACGNVEDEVIRANRQLPHCDDMRTAGEPRGMRASCLPCIVTD